MCEYNENEINEEVDENEQLDLEDMSKEELINVVYSLLDSKNKEVQLNTEDVKDIKLNISEFQAGVDSMSFLSGQYSVLQSVGIEPASCIDIILNRETIVHNQTLQRMNNESAEKIADITETKMQI